MLPNQVLYQAEPLPDELVRLRSIENTGTRQPSKYSDGSQL
jgi:hypothetical protein